MDKEDNPLNTLSSFDPVESLLERMILGPRARRVLNRLIDEYGAEDVGDVFRVLSDPAKVLKYQNSGMITYSELFFQMHRACGLDVEHLRNRDVLQESINGIQGSIQRLRFKLRVLECIRKAFDLRGIRDARKNAKKEEETPGENELDGEDSN